MRWEELFGDLEAQLVEADRQEREAEAAELTRHERAQVGWLDRVAGSMGESISCMTTAGAVDGRLVDLGRDWLVVDEFGRGSAIVPVHSVVSVGGLGRRSDQSLTPAREFGLGVALRAISRDRAPVGVYDSGGGVWVGTIDFVGHDHLEVALHPGDAVRRASAVTGRRVILWSSIAVVRRIS